MGVLWDIKRIADALEDIAERMDGLNSTLFTASVDLHRMELREESNAGIVAAILTLNKPRGRKSRAAGPLDVTKDVIACAKWGIEDPMDTEIMQKMAELTDDGDSGPLFAEEEETHA